MPKQEAVWTGRDFSMKPVDPATAINPATRTLNMVLGSNGSVKKRQGTIAGSGSLPDNHITVELDGTPYLLVKSGSNVYASDGGAATNFSHSGTDQPLTDGSDVAQATERGSFALHSGEVYYCDTKTIFSWDGIGVTPAGRRPGVVSLHGRAYNEPAADGGFGYGTVDDVAEPGCDQYFNLDGDSATADDFRCTDAGGPSGANLSDPCIRPYKGEKSLNTGFAFSYFDPIRRIYGKRSEVFACPYMFGSGRRPPLNIPIRLSPHRIQHSKVVKTPGPDNDAYEKGNTDYLIAIWMTRGFFPVANDLSFEGGDWWVQAVYSPAMSKRMNTLLFLEGNVFPLDGTGIDLVKDDSTLFASGRYIDNYNRPLPARHMMILPNGTAVYMFPSVPPQPAQGDIENIDMLTATTGNYALYSVGHPEQVGLYAETQRDTISQLPNLRGDIQAVISDGINNLALTRQSIYRIGFDGGVILSEIAGGRGVRAVRPFTDGNSIASGTAGVFWLADEGVVWLRGNSMALLDKKLGFGDWFDDLTNAERETVTIGVSDVTNQILIWHPNGSATRILCYDYERNFASEFSSLGGTAQYAAHFRSATGSHLWIWDSGSAVKYPGTGGPAFTSSVETYVSDNIDVPKTLGFLTLDLGALSGDGDLTITVEALDHAGSAPEWSAAVPSRTATISSTGGPAADRYRLEDFIGMRGRMFRIEVAAASGVNWSIQKLRAEYTIDESSNAQSN